jgi:uncharacterized protein (TIGR03118 family)
MLAASVVVIATMGSHLPSALAQSGYKAQRESSDVTQAQFASFTQYFDQQLEMAWGIAADSNPCYVYTGLACYTSAPAPEAYPEMTSTDALVNAEATDALKVFWIAASDSQVVVLFDDTGAPVTSGGLPIMVSVGGNPTGIALNPYCAPVLDPSADAVTYTSPCNTAAPPYTSVPFAITSGGVTAPAVWLTAGRDGRIYGWNPVLDLTSAVVALDSSASGADYTGLAISPDGTSLAVTDFHNGKVSVYDSSWNPVSFQGPLQDPAVLAGFAPSNAAYISYPATPASEPPENFPPPSQSPQGTHLYVTWAQQGVPHANVPEVVGPAAPTVTYPGNYGFLSDFTFNDNGSYNVTSFDIPSDKLNAPWAIALAPSEYGPDSTTTAGYLLYVGNFGDGYINIIDPLADAYLGRLVENPTPIVPPADVVPGTTTVGTTPSVPAGTYIWEVGLRGFAFKKIYYQVTPVPLQYDWANRLFFNAEWHSTAANPANDFCFFGYIRPT